MSCGTKAVVLWLLILSLSTSSAWAQSDQQRSEALAARLAHTESLTGEFEQIRHISVLAVPLRSAGTFHYRRGEGILWRTTDPVASEVRITPGEGVIAVDEEGNDRPVPASEQVAGIFLGIFSGDLERLTTYFEIASEPRDSGWALRLTPRLPAMARQLNDILLAGSDQVERVEIREPNGDRSELLLRVTASSTSDE